MSKLSPRVAAIAAIVLGILGVLDAGVLAYDHQMAALGQLGSTVCEPGSGCAAVQASPMSSIPLGRYRAKLPIALLGMACYLVVIGLGVARLRKPENTAVPRLLLAVGVLASLYSAVLLVYSLVAVGTLCPYCIGLYLIGLALLVVALLSSGESFGAWFKGVWGAIGSRAGVISLVAFVGLTGVGYTVYGGPINAELSSALGKAMQIARELPNQKAITLDVAGRPSKGPADAPVHIVEFADYQCPHCGVLYKMLNDAAAKRPGKLRITMVNFPLSNKCNPNMSSVFHANACLTAFAGECAHKQGRWQDIAGWLYENAKSTDEAAVVAEAKRLGLDAAAFSMCLKDPATETQVQKDIEAGMAAGVKGTPTYFVNGRVAPGGGPEVLDAIIDAFLRSGGGKK